jgi:hypothetical protein
MRAEHGQPSRPDRLAGRLSSFLDTRVVEPQRVGLYHKDRVLWALRSFGTDGLYPRFAGTEPLRVSAVPVTIP